MEMKKMSVVGKIWWVIYPVGLWLGISLVSELLVSLVIQIVGMASGTITMEMLMDTSFNNPIIQQILWISQIISGIAITFVGLLFMKRDRKAHGLVRDKSQNDSPLSWIAIVLLSVSLLGLTLGFQVLTGITEHSPGNQQKAEMFAAMGLGFYFVAAVIIAPVIEEIICRGLIFKRLRSFMGFLPAALISGAIFGVMHGNIVQGVYATVIGVVFAYIYEKKQSLFATMIAHAILNGTNALLMALMPAELQLEVFTNTNVIIITIISAIVCVGSIFMLKKASQNTPSWQVKTVAENI